MEWLSNNWEWVLLAFMVLEKAVKMSPSDKDDILLDVLFRLHKIYCPLNQKVYLH